MRVLHIAMSVVEQSASYRIHKALCNKGVDSYIYIKEGTLKNNKILISNSNKQKIIKTFKSYFERGILKLFNYKKKPFSIGSISTLDYSLIESINPDIINLHWICGQCVSIKDMKFLSKYKLIWTLHDSWAFTGGCHIPYDCEKYIYGCEKCEQIKKVKYFDLCKYIFSEKIKNYKDAKISIVTPSRWLAKCASQSLLFKNKKKFVIGNPIDISIFKPINKSFARNVLNIAQDSKIILFGALNSTSDDNKGFKYLYEAINLLYERNKEQKIEIIVFGSNEPDYKLNFGYNVRYMGHIYDDISLNLIYASSDVMIVPSKSESFGQTALEALSSGIPVVAFNIGGIVDLVQHKVNGYLAEPYIAKDLMNGIEFILKSGDNYSQLSINARKVALEQYQESIVSDEYIKLYKQIGDCEK